ncbi:MAG: hypothetical protein H6744_04125 [Deltaproteobacteria bacterium]|nr:hypothetical protein [Deltaproteobacteria bacterium]MCB9785865.1 hypothetical protein [Deltaproteobacteria bacterium]
MHSRLRVAGLGALALLALAACGDEKIVAVGGGKLDATTLPVGDVAPGDAPSGPDADVPTKPGELGREIVLLHDTSGDTQIAIQSQLFVRAKVIDYSVSGPAVGVTVHYALVVGADAGDAHLSSNAATTNANGEVGITMLTGAVPDVHYEIELTAEGADPVRLPVFVTDSPKGDIRVQLAYEGPIAVKSVHVRLFPSTYTCGTYNPTNVADEIALADVIKPGISSGQDILWTGLPDGQKYTIAATALSPSGSLAASGCIDGVVVIGEQENKVTLTMYLLTLNPAGTYDSESVLDFTGAIPGQLGQIVDQIVLLFNNPGKFLIDAVKDLVKSWVPAIIVDPIFSLFENQLADIVTDWMLNKSPGWIQDIFTIGQDLTQVVNKLTMLATLQISKLNNQYYVQGVLNWKGLVLYWHYGCAKEGQPGYDPECGKNSFSIDDFGNTEFPQDIISGKFTGSIIDFDKLDIDNHTIKINYGKLIIFVLNELILPAISGQHNLTDAILSFVNCGSIANGFTSGLLGSLASLFGISKSDLEDFCVDGITLIVSPVEIIIGNLALDSQLRLQGSAVLIDSSQNLLVDHIVDGIWLGHVESDGQAGPSFDGTWFADRVQP